MCSIIYKHNQQVDLSHRTLPNHPLPADSTAAEWQHSPTHTHSVQQRKQKRRQNPISHSHTHTHTNARRRKSHPLWYTHTYASEFSRDEGENHRKWVVMGGGWQWCWVTLFFSLLFTCSARQRNRLPPWHIYSSSPYPTRTDDTDPMAVPLRLRCGC